MRERNHEGYHDPTACRAVRRADRIRRKMGRFHLTYQLKENRSFQKAVEYLTVRS